MLFSCTDTAVTLVACIQEVHGSRLGPGLVSPKISVRVHASCFSWAFGGVANFAGHHDQSNGQGTDYSVNASRLD